MHQLILIYEHINPFQPVKQQKIEVEFLSRAMILYINIQKYHRSVYP